MDLQNLGNLQFLGNLQNQRKPVGEGFSNNTEKIKVMTCTQQSIYRSTLAHPQTESANLENPITTSFTEKIEFPHFDGSKPREWVEKCDQYFKLDTTIPENLKVFMPLNYTTGEAWYWMDAYTHLHDNDNWDEMVEALIQEFEENDVELVMSESESLDKKGISDLFEKDVVVEKLNLGSVVTDSEHLEKDVIHRLEERELELVQTDSEKLENAGITELLERDLIEVNMHEVTHGPELATTMTQKMELKDCKVKPVANIPIAYLPNPIPLALKNLIPMQELQENSQCLTIIHFVVKKLKNKKTQVVIDRGKNGELQRRMNMIQSYENDAHVLERNFKLIVTHDGYYNYKHETGMEHMGVNVLSQWRSGDSYEAAFLATAKSKGNDIDTSKIRLSPTNVKSRIELKGHKVIPTADVSRRIIKIYLAHGLLYFSLTVSLSNMVQREAPTPATRTYRRVRIGSQIRKEKLIKRKRMTRRDPNATIYPNEALTKVGVVDVDVSDMEILYCYTKGLQRSTNLSAYTALEWMVGILLKLCSTSTKDVIPEIKVSRGVITCYFQAHAMEYAQEKRLNIIHDSHNLKHILRFYCLINGYESVALSSTLKINNLARYREGITILSYAIIGEATNPWNLYKITPSESKNEELPLLHTAATRSPQIYDYGIFSIGSQLYPQAPCLYQVVIVDFYVKGMFVTYVDKLNGKAKVIRKGVLTNVHYPTTEYQGNKGPYILQLKQKVGSLPHVPESKPLLVHDKEDGKATARENQKSMKLVKNLVYSTNLVPVADPNGFKTGLNSKTTELRTEFMVKSSFPLKNCVKAVVWSKKRMEFMKDIQDTNLKWKLKQIEKAFEDYLTKLATALEQDLGTLGKLNFDKVGSLSHATNWLPAKEDGREILWIQIRDKRKVINKNLQMRHQLVQRFELAPENMTWVSAAEMRFQFLKTKPGRQRSITEKAAVAANSLEIDDCVTLFVKVVEGIGFSPEITVRRFQLDTWGQVSFEGEGNVTTLVEVTGEEKRTEAMVALVATFVIGEEHEMVLNKINDESDNPYENGSGFGVNKLGHNILCGHWAETNQFKQPIVIISSSSFGLGLLIIFQLIYY